MATINDETAVAIFRAIDQLHQKEINAGIGTFWEGMLIVFIGDDLNRRKGQEVFTFEQAKEVPAWLLKTADELQAAELREAEAAQDDERAGITG